MGQSNPRNYTTRHNNVAFFAEFPGLFFNVLDGGNENREVTKFRPAGSSPVNIAGPTNVEDITLTVPYSPILHGPLDAWAAGWRAGIEFEVTTVSAATNALGVPTGRTEEFFNCALVDYTRDRVQTESGEVVNLVMILRPTRKA